MTPSLPFPVSCDVLDRLCLQGRQVVVVKAGPVPSACQRPLKPSIAFCIPCSRGGAKTGTTPRLKLELDDGTDRIRLRRVVTWKRVSLSNCA